VTSAAIKAARRLQKRAWGDHPPHWRKRFCTHHGRAFWILATTLLLYLLPLAVLSLLLDGGLQPVIHDLRTPFSLVVLSVYFLFRVFSLSFSLTVVSRDTPPFARLPYSPEAAASYRVKAASHIALPVIVETPIVLYLLNPGSPVGVDFFLTSIASTLLLWTASATISRFLSNTALILVSLPALVLSVMAVISFSTTPPASLESSGSATLCVALSPGAWPSYFHYYTGHSAWPVAIASILSSTPLLVLAITGARNRITKSIASEEFDPLPLSPSKSRPVFGYIILLPLVAIPVALFFLAMPDGINPAPFFLTCLSPFFLLSLVRFHSFTREKRPGLIEKNFGKFLTEEQLRLRRILCRHRTGNSTSLFGWGIIFLALALAIIKTKPGIYIVSSETIMYLMLPVFTYLLISYMLFLPRPLLSFVDPKIRQHLKRQREKGSYWRSSPMAATFPVSARDFLTLYLKPYLALSIISVSATGFTLVGTHFLFPGTPNFFHITVIIATVAVTTLTASAAINIDGHLRSIDLASLLLLYPVLLIVPLAYLCHHFRAGFSLPLSIACTASLAVTSAAIIFIAYGRYTRGDSDIPIMDSTPCESEGDGG